MNYADAAKLNAVLHPDPSCSNRVELMSLEKRPFLPESDKGWIRTFLRHADDRCYKRPNRLGAMVILGAVREPLQSRGLKLDEALTLGLLLLDLSPDGLLIHLLTASDCLLVNPDLMLAVLHLT